MGILYPSNLDSLPKPTEAQFLDDPGFEHDVVHSDVASAIEALEGKVGVDDSAVTSSLDYLVKKGIAIVSAIAPASPVSNQLWYDSSTELMKRWDGAAWQAEGSAAYEALVSRTGATAGEVPTLQGDGTLAFAESASGALVIHKATSTERASVTSPSDDPDLVVPIAANETWHVLFKLGVTGNGGDLRFTVAAPTGATGRFGHIAPDLATSNVRASSGSFGTSNLGSAEAVGTTSANGSLLVWATVTNGATAGNVSLQWSQQTSSANATAVLSFSSLVAHQES